MHIFAIGIQSKPGRGLEGLTLAMEVAELATKVTGLEMVAWRAVAGYPIGACMLTARADDLDELNDAAAKLMTNPDYVKLQKAAADVVAEPAITQLNKVIAAGDGYVPKTFLWVVSATIAPGQFSGALAWSTEMLQHAESVTGMPVMLTLSVAGAFGEVSFAQSADSLGELQAADEKLAGDPGYVSRLDQAGGLFNLDFS